MINITVDPIFMHLGKMAITWHGFWLGAGILTAYTIFQLLGKRRFLPNSVRAEIPLVLLIVGFTGARLFNVFEDWRYYSSDPVKILAVNQGGLTVTGCILSGLVAAVLYAHLRNISIGILLDILVFAILIGDIVGRVGCLILGDVWGAPTGGPWGVIYWHPGADIPDRLLGIPTFPTPLAFQVWDFVILVFLCVLNWKSYPAGSLFTTFLGLYGFGRVIIAIWQYGESIWLGMKFIQWVGLAMIAIAILMGLSRWFQRDQRVCPNESDRQLAH